MSFPVPITVLLVDDQELVRLGLRLCLEETDNVVIVGEAADGDAAIRLTLELKPQVVIMDLDMPVVNGIDATRQIKMMLPETRVLMHTSHSDSEELLAAMAAGADSYALKTISSADLHAAIKSLCPVAP